MRQDVDLDAPHRLVIDGQGVPQKRSRVLHGVSSR